MITLYLELRVESPLLITARDQGVLYRNIDWQDEDIRGQKIGDQEQITQIYPMYHNGRNYYIPGSTIKGNLMQFISEDLAATILVKDCEVAPEHIKIQPLGKVIFLTKVEQEIEAHKKSHDTEERKAENQLLQITAQNQFFPMVAHEMICSASPLTLTIEVVCADAQTLSEVEQKIEELREIDPTYELQRLLTIIEQATAQDKAYGGNANVKRTIEIVDQLVDKVEQVAKQGQRLMFLGGYRGFYRAFEEEKNSAIYYVQDGEEQYYPIGLCTIKRKDENNV